MSLVLFDYGNVLCLPQDPADVVRMAQGIPGFEERYWELREEFDLDAVAPEAYWSHVYGRPVTGGQLDRIIEMDVASWSRPNEETAALVAELAADGVPMALLSNAPVCVADGVDRLPFMAPIGRRFFSGRMRMVKPGLEIYRQVLAALDVPAGEVVFVDDRPENLIGAEKAGIRGLHFRDAATLRDDLDRVLS